MNQRERMLAIAVGVMVAIVGVYFLWSYVDSAFRSRRGEIASLEKNIRDFKLQILQGQRANKRLLEYEARSLPPKPEVARSVYQSWLLAEVGKAGLEDQQVKAIATIGEGEVYVKQSFKITGRGTLPQIVGLLDSIYRRDYLQRVTLLVLKPIKESKQLDLTLTIEGVSMRTAPEATALHQRPSTRLALAKREDYDRVILGRNLFGPPNNPPKLASIGKQTAYIGRTFEHTVRATDADELDKVRFAMTKSSEPDARFDDETGKFRWTPKSPGEFQFVFQATDDGVPEKSVTETMTLTVTDPPPEEPMERRLAFDQAKFTILTAVLDVDGKGEVWLHIRPTGKTLKLHVGDAFEVGSIQGTVESIGESDFIFKADGKQRRLVKGEILETAETFTSGARVD